MKKTPDVVDLGDCGHLPFTTNLSIRCLKYSRVESFKKGSQDTSENVTTTS